MHTPARLPIDPTVDRHESALRFLADRIDYERIEQMPAGGVGLKLDRMRELLGRLGDPHLRMPAIHVAGTKGKGSATAMLGRVLVAAGYRVGSFTSPHLDRVEERLRLDGQPCTPEELAELVDQVRPAAQAMDSAAAARGELGPTYFELTNAMALMHFIRRRADMAVLEVGMGGRLDSTNVCSPLICIITSISLDHNKQLGDTVEQIAREKAGIVKPGVPVVSGVVEPGPREEIRAICRRQAAPLLELGVDFEFAYRPPRCLEQAPRPGMLDFRFHRDGRPFEYGDLALGLVGRHQAANAAVALAALACLQQAGWNVPEAAVRRGLAEVAWPVRVEVAARRPAVVLDAAHNVASVEALLETLDESFSPGRRLLVFAGTRDKDVRGMLARLLGRFDQVIFTRYLNNPRAVPPEQLQAIAAELAGREYPACSDPAAAWDLVSRLATADDLVCVAGSFFLAAEIRRQLATRQLSLRPGQAAGRASA